MSWRWVPNVEPPDWTRKDFPSQGEAETWLGEFYPDLVEDGVQSVSLYEADRKVYGPMSLEAEAG